MTYFEYLRTTGKDDEPESYASYLVEVCGYPEEYAQSMAVLQFRSCPKSVTKLEI